MSAPSPNHTEACALLSIPMPKDTSPEFLKRLVEKATMQLSRCRPKIATIVRAGPLGCCYVATKQKWEEVEVGWVGAYWQAGHNQPSPAPMYSEALTANGTWSEGQDHTEKGFSRPNNDDNKDIDVRMSPDQGSYLKIETGASESKVIDPTGAGNAFMGGLAAAILKGHDVEEGQL